MKRQGLQVSIKELIGKARELCDETAWDGCGHDVTQKILIPIINKEGLSDTWELE